MCTVLASPATLEAVRLESLVDPDAYIDLLVALGSGSPFSTATDVEFKEPEMEVVRTPTSAKSKRAQLELLQELSVSPF